jgi:predicted nuclease with TOPRIM domain
MLNVSATQELARKLEMQQVAMTKLQDKLTQTLAERDSLLKRLATLEARDQAREDRLARLESSQANSSIPAGYASLNQK